MTTNTQRKRQRKARQRATVKQADPCEVGARYTLRVDQEDWVPTPVYDQVVRKLEYDPLPGVAN